MTQGAVTKNGKDVHLPERVNSEDILRILDKHNQGRGALIAVLQEIQAKYGYLPEEALRTVADMTGRSPVDVYGVATFYRSFSLQPRGKHLISVCLGTACHVRGARVVIEEFERRLGAKSGGTTPDKNFTLETVNCLGACALGPMVVVDGHYLSKVRKSKVGHIIENALEGFASTQSGGARQPFPIEVSCPHCNHTLMDRKFTIDGYPSIRVTMSFDSEPGWLRLSSLYGSYSISAEHDVPAGTVVNFFCPHCHAELTCSWNCAECGAPMVRMIIRGGGVVQICSRRGCKSCMLDLSGIYF